MSGDGGRCAGLVPDYEAPPGHQRYWDGQHWTERRSTAPAGRQGGRAEPTAGRLASVSGIVWGAVAALVAVSAAVLVLGDDNPASSGPGTSPPPASTPGPPASEGTGDDPDRADKRRTWEVGTALDGTTIQLTNGAEVRLAGVVDACSQGQLARLLVGQRVTLTRRGLDKDDEGHLLRYVERSGLDVGKRLIQGGWATASDDTNARRAIYRRIDERSADAC